MARSATTATAMRSGYCCLWEFRVAADTRAEFERRDGGDGSWAQLFRRGGGCLETRLLQDRHDPLRYVTVDRSRSEADHDPLRSAFAHEYAELDRRCGALTSSERALGEYRE